MDFLSHDQLLTLSQELKGNVVQCSLDLNGNHVIQKLIHQLPPKDVELLLEPIIQEVELSALSDGFLALLHDNIHLSHQFAIHIESHC